MASGNSCRPSYVVGFDTTNRLYALCIDYANNPATLKLYHTDPLPEAGMLTIPVLTAEGNLMLTGGVGTEPNGNFELTLKSNIDWSCEKEKYVVDIDYGKIDWLIVTGTNPNLKLVVDKNSTAEKRQGELTLKLTSPDNSKVNCEVKIKVEQDGDEAQKKYMFTGSWFNGSGSVTNMVTFGEDGSYYFEQRTNDIIDFTRTGTYVVTRYKEYSENSSIRMEADITETFVTSSTGKTNTKTWTLMILDDDKLSYRNTYFWRSGFD